MGNAAKGDPLRLGLARSAGAEPSRVSCRRPTARCSPRSLKRREIKSRCAFSPDSSLALERHLRLAAGRLGWLLEPLDPLAKRG